LLPIYIQAHFGRKDANAGFSDPATAEANAKKMTEAGCEMDLVFYESGGHAFMNFGMQVFN
jgi:dienelactone hydrolase